MKTITELPRKPKEIVKEVGNNKTKIKDKGTGSENGFEFDHKGHKVKINYGDVKYGQMDVYVDGKEVGRFDAYDSNDEETNKQMDIKRAKGFVDDHLNHQSGRRFNTGLNIRGEWMRILLKKSNQ
jgi:hypothetical protein